MTIAQLIKEVLKLTYLMEGIKYCHFFKQEGWGEIDTVISFKYQEFE